MYYEIQCCNKSPPKATVLHLQFSCKGIFCAFKYFPWRVALLPVMDKARRLQQKLVHLAGWRCIKELFQDCAMDMK